MDTPVWNATVANLTLMALGSSAPEILLSVIGTLQTLDDTPPELGPSTIVGSAAFNLLMISAFSIVAVDEEPKKIYDTSVFAVTSIFSLWAYIWLFLCLDIISPGMISIEESILTLVFFVLLIVISFIADKITGYLEDKRKSKEEIEQQNRDENVKIKKCELRSIAKDYGDTTVIEVAQGITSRET